MSFLKSIILVSLVIFCFFTPRFIHSWLLSSRADKAYEQSELFKLKPKVLAKLNRLKSLSGKRWTVISAYRSAARNKKVGGAEHSQHQKGLALDLRVPHWDRAEFYKHAKKAGFKAFGWGSAAVHIDARKTKNIVWWTYNDQTKSKHISGKNKHLFQYKAPSSFLHDLNLQRNDGRFDRLKQWCRTFKWDLISLCRDLSWCV